MATQPTIRMSAAQAALDAILALLNTGGGGRIEIFDGSMPASCATADAGTKLAILPLSATAFAASVDGPSGLAQATANAITSDTNAAATGSADYFRAKASAGTVILQGTVGTATTDMILNSVNIASGDTVALTSWVVSLPDGSGTD